MAMVCHCYLLTRSALHRSSIHNELHAVRAYLGRQRVCGTNTTFCGIWQCTNLVLMMYPGHNVPSYQ
eukprot:559856-Amphidinium_carterae.1